MAHDIYFFIKIDRVILRLKETCALIDWLRNITLIIN